MIEIFDKIYYHRGCYSDLTFFDLKNQTTLDDCEIIYIFSYTMHLVDRFEFSYLISLNKKIYIDNTYEIIDYTLIDFLLNFDNLDKVYLFGNYYSPREKEKVDVLETRNLKLILSQFFIDHYHKYTPVFKDNLPYKKYLLYTGKPRPSRTMLVSLLAYHSFIDQGYVSYFGEKYVENKFHHEKVSDVYNIPMSDDLRAKIEQGIAKLKIPMTLDVDIFGREISHSSKFNADYYSAVDFVVVAETNMDEEIFFVTEKTTKPIVLNKKIIVLGTRNFISNLKEYYRSKFNKDISHLTDWCDTSYDREEFIQDRIEMIIDTIGKNL